MNDKETADYYRIRAGEYEKIYYREIPERRKEIDDEVERLRTLVAGKKILELACGTGYWTQVMSQSASEISAVDLWPEMLDEARKKSFSCPVHFEAGDMFTMQFPEASFDVIAVGFWFSHQPRQEFERFFDLIKKPLKRDGLIWMIENNPPAEGTQHEMVRTDEFGNNYKRRYLEDGSRHVILKNYFSEEELKRILEQRFQVTSMVYQKYYWSVTLADGNE